MMKAAFIFSIELLLASGVYAQQTMKRRDQSISPGVRDTGTQSTQTNLPATRRRSTASWHYHSGPKRPQVKIEELPEQTGERKREGGEKMDSTGK